FELSPFSLLNRDIGSAGFNGFNQARGKELETKFVRGSHDAALDSENIPSIVDFIIHEKKTEPPKPLFPAARSDLLEYSSRACWVVWLALIAFAIGLGWAWNLAFHAWLLPLLPAALVPHGAEIALAAYAFVLWLVLKYL